MAETSTNNSNYDVVFYFGDANAKDRLYQLKQWLQPLKRLSSMCSVAVVTSSLEAEALARESSLPVVNYKHEDATLGFPAELKPGVILYPNKGVSTPKFTNYPGAVHIFVSHGESDKAYMSDNTLKYFDFVYTAGEMAVQRIVERLSDFNVKARCLSIGRPQVLDTVPPPPVGFDLADKRKTILYAPTSDFVTRSNRYGSVETHGVAIVNAILAHGDRYRLIYKPHPLTGSKLPGSKQANEKIIEAIAKAGNGHLFDQSPFGWQVQVADLMISDISAVIYDWLATSKPLLVTKPVEPLAWVYEGGILGAIDLVLAEESNAIVDRISKALENETQISFFETWGKKYYAPVLDAPDGEERFIVETRRLVNWSRHLSKEQGSVSKPKAAASKKGLSSLISARQKAWLKELLARLVNRTPSGDWQVALHLTQSPLNIALAKKLAEKQRTLLLVNSLGNFLRLKKQLLQNPGEGKKLKVYFAPAVHLVTRVLVALKPDSLWYLSHGHNNHFGIRSHEARHILYCPELQPGFKIDHSLIAYDEIQITKEDFRPLITEKIFRPDSWQIETIS